MYFTEVVPMLDISIVVGVDAVAALLADLGVPGFVMNDDAARRNARRRVYRLAQAGRLPSFSARGRLRFIASEVEAVARRGAL
jgi:hypothetical protein